MTTSTTRDAVLAADRTDGGPPYRGTAVAVGVLFLVATAFYLVGDGLIASALEDPGRLLGPSDTPIGIGALLELVAAAANVTIGVLLFPVLADHYPRLALGYVATRVIESILLLVSALGVLLFLPLGPESLATGAIETAQLHALAAVAAAWYALAFQMAMIVLSVGAVALCYVLYQVRLVPRMLAVLGILGYVALFVNGWLEVFGYGTGGVLYLPGAVFEVLLPLWLIVKGFAWPDTTAQRARARGARP